MTGGHSISGVILFRDTGWLTTGVPPVPCRQQQVDVQGSSQGSVLGPLLFSLYIRTLPSALRKSLLSQYADDRDITL